MARPLTIEPVDATFGAVVTGFRITELDDAAFQALYAAWLKYALLIFPGQNLTRDQQIAFAKRFGPLEFEMTALSNVKEDGTLRLEKDNDDRMKILKGNMGWHADSTYMPVQAKGAVFCAEEVPSIGGHTGWADMRSTANLHARQQLFRLLDSRLELRVREQRPDRIQSRREGGVSVDI